MITSEQIAAIREDYTLKEFNEKDLIKNPFEQFKQWFHEAISAEVNEPNAMTLATTNFSGRPTARIVLLKGINEEGLMFYTNYNSDKGKQMQSNPYAALVFFWPELQRQVRVEGRIKKVSSEVSDEYFKSRPIDSQIGAHASPQSQPIEGRHIMTDKLEELKKLFSETPIIRPIHWGGYILEPDMFEFWQGRASRLHDRFKFSLIEGNWVTQRLAP
jgi:pyridoxamine 5'-phosphate oxidase